MPQITICNSTTLPANMPVSRTGQLIVQFASAAPALALNASYKVAGTGAQASNAVTVSSIPAGAIVIVFGFEPGISLPSPVASSANLSFTTLETKDNIALMTAVNGGTPLTDEVVTFTPGDADAPVSLIVEVWTGANSSQLTNHGQDGNYSGGPPTSAAWGNTATRNGSNSIITVGSFNWTDDATFTPGADTTVGEHFADVWNNGFLAVRDTTSGTGTSTLTGTWGAFSNTNDVWIEIRSLN